MPVPAAEDVGWWPDVSPAGMGFSVMPRSLACGAGRTSHRFAPGPTFQGGTGDLRADGVPGRRVAALGEHGLDVLGDHRLRAGADARRHELATRVDVQR